MPDRDFTDPRDLGGDMAGPGGPHDHHGVVLDTERALILEHLAVVVSEQRLDNGHELPLVGLVLEGRINQTTDEARLLVLMPPDGAAAIVTEIVGIASRDIDGRRQRGDDVAAGFGAQFKVALDERREQMP